VIITPEERSAKKKAQVARVGAKGTPQYAVLYAQQPEQIRLKAKAEAKRAAEREAADAIKRATLAAGDEAASLWGSANEMRVK
jgi:hypothetical protein